MSNLLWLHTIHRLIERLPTQTSFKTFIRWIMSQRKGLSDLFGCNAQGIPGKQFLVSHQCLWNLKQFSEFEYFPCSNLKVKKNYDNHDALFFLDYGFRLRTARSSILWYTYCYAYWRRKLVEEGVTGHLVPIRNPSKIAEAIVRFIMMIL